MARKQVSWRTLAYMLAGGIPGVLIGVFLLRGLDAKLISGIIGLTVMIIAIFNLFRPRPDHRKDKIHKFGHMHLDDLVDRRDRFKNELVIAAHLSTRYHSKTVKALVAKALPDMLDGRLHLWL